MALQGNSRTLLKRQWGTTCKIGPVYECSEDISSEVSENHQSRRHHSHLTPQSNKNSVAVIQPCQDQRHYQSDKRLPADWAMRRMLLSWRSTAKHPATTLIHVTLTGRSQSRLRGHARRRMDRISSNDDWRNRQLMHTLTRAAPQELCLSHVPKFTEPANWPSNGPHINPVDYSAWRHCNR